MVDSLQIGWKDEIEMRKEWQSVDTVLKRDACDERQRTNKKIKIDSLFSVRILWLRRSVVR